VPKNSWEAKAKAGERIRGKQKKKRKIEKRSERVYEREIEGR